jgi:phosphatidate cytidylyltransferase
MLKIRVLTATVALALFLPALFLLPKGAWLGLCALGLCVAAWEWACLAALGTVGRLLYAALLVALFLGPAILGAPWVDRSHAPTWAYLGVALFWIVLAPLWIRWRPRIAGTALLGVGALILLPAFSAAVDLRNIRPGLLLAVLATVWVSDTAAYFTGRRFGKRRLAPSISPGKTWEGVGGALAAVALYGFGWTGLSGAVGVPEWLGGMPTARFWIVPILLGLAVAGIIGDLFESLIKRQAGVKDSGRILPGHGGILDRIDAPVATLPLAMLAFMR